MLRRESFGPLSDHQKLDGGTNLLFEIGLADNGGFLRRSRFIRDPIEFDDGPPVELNLFQRSKNRRKIDAPTAELHELKGISCVGRIGRNVADCPKVQEEKAIVIFFNRFGRVAPARDEMGGIKLELDVVGIGIFEYAVPDSLDSG